MLPPKKLTISFGTACCLALLSVSFAFAQQNSKDTRDFTDAVTGKVYYYPQFQKGAVTFITGGVSNSTLNYNMISEEIEFISAKKDTLVLDDIYIVNMITIGTDTFFYDTGSAQLLKQIKEIGGKKLLVKEAFKLSGIKSSSAASTASGTASISSNSEAQNTRDKLKQQESLLNQNKPAFYLGYQAGYLPATLANLLKLFPKHADALTSYIKENNLSMNNEEEMKKLLLYASSL